MFKHVCAFFTVVIVILAFILIISQYMVGYRGTITGISDISFFTTVDDGIIYFGRPTCPDCQRFETVLKDVVKKRNYTVYYFNTQYWKYKEGFQEVISKYAVESVPTLIKLRNGCKSEELLLEGVSNINLKQQTISLLEKNRKGGGIEVINFSIYVYACVIGLSINLLYVLFKLKKTCGKPFPVLFNSVILTLISNYSIFQNGIYADENNLEGDSIAFIANIVGIILLLLIIFFTAKGAGDYNENNANTQI